MTDDGLLEVGHIRRAHGLRGDVFVQLLSDSDARVAPGSELFANGERLVVETSRVASNGRRVVKFAQIPDRTAAERYANRALRGHPIHDPDALWVHEMIGRRVVDADGVATEAKLADIEAGIQAELDAAVTFALEAPFPGLEEITRDVYGDAA